MSSDQIDKLGTVLPTGTIESNVSITIPSPGLNQYNNVQSNIEAGSSDELSFRHDSQCSPLHTTTAMLGNDSNDYNPSA